MITNESWLESAERISREIDEISKGIATIPYIAELRYQQEGKRKQSSAMEIVARDDDDAWEKAIAMSKAFKRRYGNCHIKALLVRRKPEKL